MIRRMGKTARQEGNKKSRQLTKKNTYSIRTIFGANKVKTI